MTVRAGHLAFRNRVVRGLVQLRALFLVAGVAGVSLGLLVENFVFVDVHLMAGVAGDTRVFMSRTGPQGPLLVFVMAILTRAVPVVSGHRADLAKRLAKSDVGLGLRADLGRIVSMRLACAMATDAVRRTFVSHKTVRRPAVVRQVIGVVTGHAEGGPGGLGLGSCPRRAEPT